LQGTYDVDFTAIVPECAYTATEPVGIMIYGHGLLGEGDQVASGAVRSAVAEACVVALGTDMRGMSSRDIGAVATALTDFNRAEGVFEVLVQGLINHIALRTVAQGAMAERLFVKDGGGSLVDPSKVYYYGISQGGIFGTPVVAWDPAIRRGVLGVGAGGYANMLERSSDWPQYRTILLGAYPDSLDLTLLINLMQMRWDKTETASIAHVATDGVTLDSGGPKQILMQIALGDDQVPNLASWWQARTMGIPVLGPSVEEPWGMQAATGPLTDSALVIFDGRAEGDPEIPDENVPAPNTGAHYVPRNQPATWRQIKTFYETGMIVNECDGACLCPDACQ
jgi:hypothetical protein